MENIQDEDDARNEIGPLADALGVSHQTMLDIIMVTVICVCIVCLVLMWRLHCIYSHEQRRRNTPMDDLEGGGGEEEGETFRRLFRCGPGP